MEIELSSIVDALPGLVWTALPNGLVDFLSQLWCEFTGMPLNKLYGNGWQTAIHPDDRPQLLANWQASLVSGEPLEMETHLQRFDGGYRRFLFRVRAITDASGQVIKWCGVNTELGRQSEPNEAQNEEPKFSPSSPHSDFRLIADTIPALIALMTPAGEVESVNQRALEYFGATLEELKSWTVTDTVHRDDLPAVIGAWTRSVETGQPYDIEHRMRRADGVYRWFRVNGMPLRDRENRVVRWCVLQTDIDDQKRAEALIAGEKRVLELIAAGESLSVTLTELCLLAEDLCSRNVFASVSLLDHQTKKLWHAASPNLPEDYKQAINGFSIGPDVNSCGAAAFYAREIIASDIASDPHWCAFRHLALRNGLLACCSTPILSRQNRVLGTFALFAAERANHTSHEHALIAQATHLAAIAIERERSQKSLTRALDELTKSERRFRTTVDAIPGFVWSAAPDGSVDFLNQPWCDYTGISVEDARGWGWAASIHPDDASGLAAYWNSLLQSGESGECEARVRRFDGTFRWFLIRTVPLRDSDGHLVKWYGLNTEIEDRKRAEDALRRSEARNAAILDSALDCIVTIDHEGRITEFNPAAERTFGFHRNQVIGKYLSDVIVPPGRRENHRRGLARYVASGESRVLGRRMEMTALRADGTEFPVELAITRIPLDGLPSFTGYLRDVTERNRAEEELRRSEALLAQGQHLGRMGTFWWRLTTNEIVWSEQLYRIFEFDQGVPMTLELIGTRVHPDDTSLLQDMIERANSAADNLEYEHRLLMPDQSVKHLHLMAHRTQDKDGRLEYIGAVQDVTQRRLSDEALSKARSELAHVARVTSLGVLTASIAHEVNQPLSGIVTNASTCLRMLATDPPNIDGARETARRTIRDGNRASEVVTRLRALFSNRNGSAEWLDLNEAIREVIALSLSELQRNRVVLRPELAENLPAVRGDRVQLQQVILNLLLNASDAMSNVEGRPRQLVIRAEKDGEAHVRVSMQDSGIGFEPQVAEKLFDAFYTTKTEGMGIGLSVSRSIIECHRGRVWAAANDGPGATFSFSIPCDPLSAVGGVAADAARIGRIS